MPSVHRNIDFIAYDTKGHVVLLAEAKSRHGTSEQWATRLRRNMLSHGLLPLAKYFLIVTPERLYLWNQERPEQAPEQADAAPEYTVDAAKEFQPWFRRLSQQPSDIGPEAFELLVLAWLNDIARSGNGLNRDVAAPWLAELTGPLQQGRIEMNPLQ